MLASYNENPYNVVNEKVAVTQAGGRPRGESNHLSLRGIPLHYHLRVASSLTTITTYAPLLCCAISVFS